MMCEIFAGQNPQNYAFETRSVRLMGHVTSVKLETKFWDVIEDISDAQNMTQAQFLTQLYSEALEIHGEISNFASLLRCCCLMFKSGNVAQAELLPITTAKAS
ncbi:ribbon-helix-helix domain-containing protein [Alphaproteobacteria bacterium]|jgi:predicted DNA-binding ribbon-helix-helix protein|nr:ribbon-helix-helix domain-containing protein [Alphaproteobacteria bacterium]